MIDMKKYIPAICLIILLAFNQQVIGQEKDELPLVEEKTRSKLREKLFFGGGLGLQFGTITQIDVMPLVGYRVIPNLATGLSFTYKYYNNSLYHYSTSVYGGGVFIRFIAFRNFFAHAEYEMLNLDVMDPVTGDISREWVESILVGPGYRQPLGEHSFFYIMMLWNLNETYKSPYTNPIFRVGFIF